MLKAKILESFFYHRLPFSTSIGNFLWGIVVEIEIGEISDAQSESSLNFCVNIIYEMLKYLLGVSQCVVFCDFVFFLAIITHFFNCYTSSMTEYGVKSTLNFIKLKIVPS